MTHVVADFFPSSMLTNGLSLVTLNAGVNLTVRVANGSITVRSPGSSASVIQKDLQVGNAVAQVGAQWLPHVAVLCQKVTTWGVCTERTVWCWFHAKSEVMISSVQGRLQRESTVLGAAACSAVWEG